MKRGRSPEAQITSIFVACIAGLLFAGVLSMVCPKKYRSVASVEVDSPAPKSLTEIADIVHSEAVLSKVAAMAKFKEEWPESDSEQNIARLRKMISVNEIRNTELIQIGAIYGNAQFAADIANAVTQEYQAFEEKKGARNILIWEYADVPEASVFPNPIFYVLSGLCVALGIWIIFQFVGVPGQQSGKDD